MRLPLLGLLVASILCAQPSTPYAQSTAPHDIVAAARWQYPRDRKLTEAELVDVLHDAAAGLNAAKIPGGPFGLLRKTSSHNCDGFSCDVLCSGQGTEQRQWDVLKDAEGADGLPAARPMFSRITGTIRVDLCSVVPASPDPPSPPAPIDYLKLIDALAARATALEAKVGDLQTRVDALEQAAARPYPCSTGRIVFGIRVRVCPEGQ